MKLNKKITTATLAITTFVNSVIPTFAQSIQPRGAGITNPVIGDLGKNVEAASSGSIFLNYFVNIWNTLITIGGIIVLIMFLWGGLEWITAGGDSSKIEKARNRIMQSLIGLIILVGSFIIIGFISQLFFGGEFNLLNLSFSRTQHIIPGGTE